MTTAVANRPAEAAASGESGTDRPIGIVVVDAGN
ncbi:hypothetical protein EDD40_2133 [Saccharothrix texasensis]|uniref:Uncharacterized protein n=1 Tax=Saccharothrix texasensis TaxID=103734 RepID=A0A3N1H2X1_9PSEU|nr:hypothetical protein EDD40_2133 [Saccharothrix texasensis]